MEDFDTPGQTPARQVVGLFESSPLQAPDREDVEIAASLICGDAASFMEMFDGACAVRSLADGASTRLGTSFSKVREFASGRMAAGDLETLERMAGGSLSEGCRRRILASREDSALAMHHMASAADHYAHDVISALSSLIGRPADGISVTAAADDHAPAIRDLPFLCFLHPSTTEAANA